jgi:death-on-curing family protein
MDGTSKVLVLSLSRIVKFNRYWIEQSGEDFIGDDNLLFRQSLEYVLETIKQPSFGEDRFPTIFHKAAAIAEKIIVGHVFFGANKRTGLSTCATVLRQNGWNMQIYGGKARFDPEAIRIALALQDKEISFEDFVEWVRSRSVPKENSTDGQTS